MLTPEQIEEAGELVARVYRGIEAEMLDHLADVMLQGRGVTSMTVTSAALLGQTHAGELRAIMERAAPTVDAEVRATVERFLAASDADDMERLGIDGAESWPRQVEATVAGLAEILERDNVAMESGALEAYLRACTDAITKVNTGAATAERALHQAVRQLERDGITVVQYRDAAGNETVANRVDVAVRRHVRTQIAQDGARMTAAAMDRYGVQLVEVSSHPNARPSHAVWQGRVYGWRGGVTVDGTYYEGLEAATGYGSVDGLLGANCRHSFGPYLPGTPRAYEPNPRHASGLPGEEVYRLEQRQRAGERAIREAKRELRGAQKAYQSSPTLSARTDLLAAQERLKSRQEAMRRLVSESNALSKTGEPVLHRHPAREWAGDVIKGARASGSGRGLDDFLKMGSTASSLRRAGASASTMRSAIVSELRAQGCTAKDFRSFTASEQQAIFNRLLGSLGRKKAAASPSGGKAFRRIKGSHTAEQDLAATNPNYSPSDPLWSLNCQRCVSAYEARRRGYDVTAKPRDTSGADTLPYMRHPQGWPQVYENPDLVPCFSNSGANTKGKVEAQMAAWGDGARAIVRVQWRGGNSGHVFIAEQVNGATRFVDPQCNSTDCSDYFKSAKKNQTYVMRVDDRKFTDLVRDCCEEVRR